MRVNSKARIEIMHSKRGVQKVTKTWSALCFEWLGARNPELPRILDELKTTGESSYADASGGVFNFKALDPMEIAE